METPRLSPSIAKILLDKSPKHAWQAHRLLGGTASQKTESLLLGNAADVAVLGVEPKPDGKKKRPAPKRDAKAKAIADAVKEAMAVKGIAGTPQYRVEWTSKYGVECSGMVDLTDNVGGRFWDLKTANDLSDHNIVKQIEVYRYNLQVAAYKEALESAGIFYFQPFFIFVESAPPHDVRVVDLTQRMLEQGLNDWHTAVAKWKGCLERNEWPGRGDFTADVSGWRKKQETDKWLSDSGIE